MLTLENLIFSVSTLDSVDYEEKLYEAGILFSKSEENDLFSYRLLYDSSLSELVRVLNFDAMCDEKIIMQEIYIPTSLADYAMKHIVENKIECLSVRISDDDTIMYLTATDLELSSFDSYLDKYGVNYESLESIYDGVDACLRIGYDSVDTIHTLYPNVEQMFFLMSICNNRDPPIPYRLEQRDGRNIDFVCTEEMFGNLQQRLIQYELWKTEGQEQKK